MEATLQALGVREAKNNFSKLAQLVNETGQALTVLKNGRPWVQISPADASHEERRRRLALLHQLTAQVEQDAEEPAWDASVADKELLGRERVKRFG